MQNKFIIGAVAGMSSLALAVPILAQVSGAQESNSSGMQIQEDQLDAQTDTQIDSMKGGHVGPNGMREELLTADDASRATAAALEAVPGGTIDRVETDTEGDVYEAHMTKADGTRVTVKFDANFNVTRIEEGHMGGHKDRVSDKV